MKSTKSAKSAITGLTVNQENFAQNLAKGYDNPTSYCMAFGNQKCSRKVLMEKSLKLAKSHGVLNYTEQLREETRARGVIERDWIVDKLKELADVGMERTQVVSVKREKTKGSGDWVQVEEERWLEKHIDASSANSALDKLIKMGGLYAAEKVETEHKVKGKFILNLKRRTDESA